MFKLGRRTPVLGSYSPAVDFIAFGVPSSGVDHRFDREAHSGVQPVDTRLAIREMGNRWVEVELSSQSMSHVLTDYGESASVSLWNDSFTDLRHAAARRQGIDRQVHAVKSTLRNSSLFLGDLSNEERLALVTVPAVHDGCEIEVNDIAVLKHVIAWNSVADHFIGTDAAALWEAVVSQSGRFVTARNGPLVDPIVNFASICAHDHQVASIVH